MFDAISPTDLLRKYKSLRRELLNTKGPFIKKRVAVLGGSTTTDICKMIDIHLLFYGIQAEFYESEYGQYWQDAMFDNPKLTDFKPDIIFIHTSNRNISQYPKPCDSVESVDTLLNDEYGRFSVMWDKLLHDYKCPIIQNNFEYKRLFKVFEELEG